MIEKLDDRNPQNLKDVVDTTNQLIDQREQDKKNRDKQIAEILARLRDIESW